ncbi:unnamed protein product [Schistocephalus solidus]|uniref:Uncharacterized protein n=1 Tax=Schistocephalus solidus TaxID=70667 RepID=A0A183SN95_SCHSO|nr:unnamed protein product [Schistocephalus solidus]
MRRLHSIPPSLVAAISPPQGLLIPGQPFSPWESSYRKAGFRSLHLAWDAQELESLDDGLSRLSTEQRPTAKIGPQPHISRPWYKFQPHPLGH